MTDIVNELQHITSNSRLAKEKEIQEVLKDIEWDSIRGDSVESAKNSAKQGKSSVEITITPTQYIGSCHEERHGIEWTPARAYRRAFDEHTKTLFSKMGFTISTRMQPDWHSGTFLYCYTLSWSENEN